MDNEVYTPEPDNTWTERDEQLRNELLDGDCACGRRKNNGNSFCFGCYKSLSSTQKRALYKPIGDGYAEAYDSALTTLRAAGRVRG